MKWFKFILKIILLRAIKYVYIIFFILNSLLILSPSYSIAQALWGMAELGGTYNGGVIFEYNLAGSFTVVSDFDALNTGSDPFGSLILARDGNLYGMTNAGGISGDGTIFQYNLSTSTITKLIDFVGSNGSSPEGSLVQASNGMLYGMTAYGGTNMNCYNGCGLVFTYNLSTSTYTKLLDFTGITGIYPGWRTIRKLKAGKQWKHYME